MAVAPLEDSGDLDIKHDPNTPFDTADEAEDDSLLIKNEDEDDLDVKDISFSAPAPTNDIAPMSLFSLASYHQMKWRQCDLDETLTELQKVQIKEAAVSHGMRSLDELRHFYKSMLKEEPMLQTQIVAIDTIRRDKKKCEVKVGFLGTTGAGKSSLINCLLGLKDLLPADDGKACTAVCVQVSYNHEEDPAKAFIAKISCLSQSDWRQEIETLIKDIDDEAHNRDAEDGELDVDRADRIKTAFQNVAAAYPQFKKKEDLLSVSVEQLMKSTRVQEIFQNGDRVIEDSDLQSFALKIKPYIDSNNATGENYDENFTFWPLVKQVSLFVKSQVLEDGVCLVDLPGNYDTNAARSSVAAKFSKNLTVCFVVASARRAPSDKPAQDLLGIHRQRTMQLDGQFSTDRLVFIMTMCDASITTDRYLKNNPGAKRNLGDTLKRQKEAILRRKTVEAVQSKLLHEQSVLADQIKEKKQQAKKIAEVLKPIALPRETTPINMKRKYDETSADTTHTTNDLSGHDSLREQLMSLRSQIESIKSKKSDTSDVLLKAQDKLEGINRFLEHCESKILSTCIKYRHKDSASAIRKDFDATARQMRGRRKKGNTERQLEVFSVSALAYMTMFHGASFPGFNDIEDTGIPGLREWLVLSTLPFRRRSAEATLEAIISFELSTLPHFADRSVGFKMSKDHCQTVEGRFKACVDALSHAIIEDIKKLVQSCARIVGNMFKLMPKMELDASNKAEGTVRSWFNKPMHWSTHRATNKYRGTYKQRSLGTREEKLIQWNEDLAGHYIDPLIPRWATTIHHNLPNARAAYLETFKDEMEGFVETAAHLTIEECPEMAVPVNLWKASAIRTLIRVDEHSSAVFSEVIGDTAKHSHPLIITKIQEEWEPIYRECGAAGGTGHYKANQKRHLEFVREVKQKMYQRGSAAIRAAFKQLWKDLPNDFQEGADAALAQIGHEFQTLIDNHTITSFDATKKHLHERTVSVLERLAEQWAVPVEFEEVEVKIKLEPELPSVDDLEKPTKKPGEDDIFYISD